jgi:uncharacterized protein YndB with AHSA1/START domain
MTATNTIPAIEKEATINAPAAKIFAALTEPVQLVHWWGEGSETTLRNGRSGRWWTLIENARTTHCRGREQ